MSVPNATTQLSGGCTFAENPDLAAREARIIWRACRDPAVLIATARPAAEGDPEGVSVELLRPWCSITSDGDGEHIALSDGFRRIRIDLKNGSINSLVVLTFSIEGTRAGMGQIESLRRAMSLIVRRRFPTSLFPEEPRAYRSLTLLRVHDALTEGASQRQIAAAFFGEERARQAWSSTSDSLRSQIRRMIVNARHMASGKYRSLLTQST